MSNLSVAYYTRHSGASNDFTWYANLLGLRWSRLSPVKYCPVLKEPVSNADRCWRLLKDKCEQNDIIIVGDLNPDGYPFLHGKCKSWVLFLSSTRFDWGHQGNEKYYGAMRIATGNERVIWMANNPLERPYAASRGVHIPDSRYYLARPAGVSLVQKKGAYVPTELHHMVVVSQSYYQRRFLPLLKDKGIRHATVKNERYSSSRTLAAYAAVLVAPYQASTRAFYEVLSAGGTFLVPSARLWVQEVMPKVFGSSWATCRCDFLQPLMGSSSSRGAQDWQELVEWWHPDFRPALVYFDSWQELQGNIDSSTGAVSQQLEGRLRAAKGAAVRIMAQQRERSLKAFRQVFEQVARAKVAGQGAGS